MPTISFTEPRPKVAMVPPVPTYGVVSDIIQITKLYLLHGMTSWQVLIHVFLDLRR